MFPIRDHNPSGRPAYVNTALIVVNVAVFLTYWLSLRDSQFGWFLFQWGLVPGRALAGRSEWTLLTHMFLHGGWLHLAFNMLFLWIFGDNLEDALGHVRYLVFYLVCGLAGAGLHIAGDPYGLVPMVGASGAIAGVLGGYLVLFPKARVDVLFFFVVFFRIFAIPAWIVLGFWFGLQLLHGLDGTQDGVAYLAHVGGFLAGLVLGGLALLRRGGRVFWAGNAGRPHHPAAEYRLSRTSIPRVRRR